MRPPPASDRPAIRRRFAAGSPEDVALERDQLYARVCDTLSRRGRPRAARAALRPASTRSATTTCATRSRRPSRRARGGAAAVWRRCSIGTTPSSTPRSGRRSTACAPGRSPAGGLRLRHGAAEPGQATARARARRPRFQRHARARARRLPARVRHGRRARPAAARLDRRRHADVAVFPRPAGRARHGRLRALRSLHPRFTAERPIAFIPSYR